MEIIEYFTCHNPEHWLDRIGTCDWAAGRYLYKMLKEKKLEDMVGKNPRVLMLVEGEELAAFCTYTEKDDIQPTDLTPWMGFVYTFPKYRGRHYMGELFREVERLAKEEKVQDIFISTDHEGLYEKYGCEFYRMMEDIKGYPARVYRKHFE